MKFALVKVAVAPVRSKPWHEAELTNQLFFGEPVKILKEKNKLWVKIRNKYDRYEGWVRNNLLEKIEESTYLNPNQYITNSWLTELCFATGKMLVPLGSNLPSWNGQTGKLGEQEFTCIDKGWDITKPIPSQELIIQFSSQWLNAPYLWGGKTILGVDCSGFVQTVFKQMGMVLPRDAWEQAEMGELVNKFSKSSCGNLAFFHDNEEIIHVGILLPDNKIIHASGKVQIDAVDKKGIINTDTGKYSHFLRSIKKYF